jgi:hypothetical protein
MKASSASRGLLSALGIGLLLCLLPTATSCQVLHIDRTTCDVYSYQAMDCVPPIEIHRESPDLFSTHADTAQAAITACSGYARSWAEQQVYILPDSIYIHQYCGAHTGNGQARCESNTAITFSVPAGSTHAYRIWGTFYTFNDLGGTAIAKLSLSKVTQAGDSLIASEQVQSGPGTVTEWTWAPFQSGVLHGGQYVYEAHARSETSGFGSDDYAELWLRFPVRDVTTEVDATTWTGVKSLYR